MNRAKGGEESVHPLHGPELRALRPLQGNSPYVFVTEAGTPVTTAWFLRMVQRTGKAAKLPFPIHPHMLQAFTGYKLANQGEDTRSLAHYLGHRNLQSTARYTALAPDRFKDFGRIESQWETHSPASKTPEPAIICAVIRSPRWRWRAVPVAQRGQAPWQSSG